MGRKYQRKELSDLPPEIIFIILLHLPAEFLWRCARCVCRAWKYIISEAAFAKAHFLKSKDTLLLDQDFPRLDMQYVKRLDGYSSLSKARLSYIFPGVPMNRCRGLFIFMTSHTGCLLHDWRIGVNGTIWVGNPVTGQIEQLPSLGLGFYKCVDLTYISQTEEFKAVCVFSNGGPFSLLTFSLGIDMSWRRLNSIIPETTWEGFPCLASVTVGEYVHILQGSNTTVMINLNDGTAHRIQFTHGHIFELFGLLRMGDHVSCLVHKGDHAEVWVLRDLEWVKVGNITEAVLVKGLCRFSWIPIGWVDKYLIFATQDPSLASCMAYNADTGKTVTFSSTRSHVCCSQILRNSLLMW